LTIEGKEAMTAKTTSNRSLKIVLILLLLTSACNDSPESETSALPINAKTSPELRSTGAQSSPAEAVPFRSRLELDAITFLVESPNTLVGNAITVIPSGLKTSNDSFTSPVSGEVIDAQVGDLNTDRSPELYVFVRERDGIGSVNVIAYATNARKSMSEFSLPDPDVQAKEYAGYNGGDQFEVVKNTLARRFPLYETSGGQLTKTGRTRVIQYKIKPGEATWQFYVHRFDDF
jgi:hypothetical protein